MEAVIAEGVGSLSNLQGEMLKRFFLKQTLIVIFFMHIVAAL